MLHVASSAPCVLINEAIMSPSDKRASVTAFLKRVAGTKFKMSVSFSKNSFLSFNISWIILFELFSFECRF